MKLVQLEYFCAVCRYHSITRAAEELYVTQPTISVAIRELEKELKLRLFHHEKNRISITQEGEAFYRRAEAVLKETRAMVTEFSSLGEKETPIRIGIPPLISTVFFPAMSDRFQEKTGLAVQLFEYGSVKACRMVQEESLDDQHSLFPFPVRPFSGEDRPACAAVGIRFSQGLQNGPGGESGPGAGQHGFL